jgi:iron complex transport system substrate-binding protein
VSVRDDLGHSTTLAAPPQRIVSLIPSATETLFAIGCGPQVVADTVYDDYPSTAVKLPKIGSGTHPSAESILAFHPDLVVATDGNPPELLNELAHLHVAVFAVHPRTVQQVEECIRRLGRLTGHSEHAHQVSARMEVRVARIEKAVASYSSHPVTGLIEVGYNPLFVAGPSSFMGDVFRLAGGRNVAPARGDYVELSAEGVLSLNPQTIFLSSEENPSVVSVRNRPGWSRVAAVRSGRIYIEDASLLDRPGPRVVLGLQDLALKLYPQAFARPESNSHMPTH